MSIIFDVVSFRRSMAQGFALFVLCSLAAAFPGTAAAETPDGRDDPAKNPLAAPAPAPPASAPAPPAPSTPVDPRPSPEIHAPSPPAAASPAPTPAATGAASSPTAADAPRFRDAHHDRLLLMPTAETSPEGSVSFSDYEIVVLQIGFAPSDRTQVTLTGAPPLGDEHVLPLDITVKTVVLRSPRLSLALMASVSGIFGLEENNGFVGRGGAVVTFCEPSWTCRLGLSMATNVALLGPASLAFTGFGGSFRLGRLVSLVAELDTAVPLGPPVGEANGVLGGAGVRLSKAAVGLDLGFFVGGKPRAPAVAAPWVAFTYRML